MPEPVSHDAFVLVYLHEIAKSSPLLTEQIERAKLLVQRDLMQAELDRLNESRPSLKPVPKANDAQA